MTKGFKRSVIATGVLLALGATAAQASHFRGGAMVPSVSASGLLTVEATTFWRTTSVEDIDEGGAIAVAGVGSMTQVGAEVEDTSDSRFTKVTSIHTIQLTGAGTYNFSASSCCRVSGIRNFSGGSSTSWTLNSTIVWDGSSATAPILFNFSAIQPEVVRGSNYTGNLGAVAGQGLTLSYDQVLNAVIGSQPPGFTINPTTGDLFIPAASTSTYLDNSTNTAPGVGNVGADYSFSGNIKASNGSSVEFEWLFDAVNTGTGNRAPQANDVIINALVGDTVTHTFTGVDDGNPIPPGALTWTFVDFLGAATPFTPTFNAATQQFSWNTAGAAIGTYVAQVRVSDGALTDIGLLTINVGTNGGGGGGTVPLPGVLPLLGIGLLGMAGIRRKR